MPIRNWVRDRFSDSHPKGLFLTLGSMAVFLLTAGFLSIAKDVLLFEDLARIDRAILGFIQDYRTTVATAVLRVVTNLAGIEAVAIGLTVLLIAARRNRLLQVLFVGAVLLGVLITQTLKVLFGRLRPDEALRLVVENGFSFPSGHTFLATLLFGLGGYVVARGAVSRAGRWVSIGVSLALIGLVALSRMYLGVHYPSDVLASFLFASAIVSVIVTLLEINRRFNLYPRLQLASVPGRPLTTALIAMILVALVQVIIG